MLKNCLTEWHRPPTEGGLSLLAPRPSVRKTEERVRGEGVMKVLVFRLGA